MNADYIQYESLIAARDAAYWAYLSMIGTWVSAIATLIAAAVAFWAIRGWRVQEEAHELKEFRVCAYNFHNAMVCVPEYNSDGLNELQSLAVQNAFNALNEIHMSTLKMHSKKQEEWHLMSMVSSTQFIQGIGEVKFQTLKRKRKY